MGFAEDQEVVIEGFRAVTGMNGTAFEHRMVHSVAELETGFGRGWTGAGRGSNNMGAIQSGRIPCDPAFSFQYTDTTPQPDGSSKPYSICFKKYPSRLEGIKDLVRVMVMNRPAVKQALKKRSELGVSAALYISGYYEGFGPDEDDRILNHYLALFRNARKIAIGLGEPPPVGAKLVIPPEAVLSKATIKRGSSGPLVAEWQRILGLVADGQFGPATEVATKQWQQIHGLAGDGIVGPATWATGLK